MKVHSFFVMDENFLLKRKRALQLLERMKEGGKSWELYVFSSANAIRKYTMEELVQLGVSWMWLGLESPQSQYTKLNGADTDSLAASCAQHGIKLLGSTIIGLEHHTPENISRRSTTRSRTDTDFHQFMLYTPVPGTPLYQQMEAEGRMLDVDLADIHGQYQVQLRARGDFARRLQALSRLGVPLRSRTEWPQPVSHLRHYLSGLEAVPRPS